MRDQDRLNEFAGMWNEPKQYALVKEDASAVVAYSIWSMEDYHFCMLDEEGYGNQITQKMIESGVIVFGSMSEFLVYQEQHPVRLPLPMNWSGKPDEEMIETIRKSGQGSQYGLPPIGSGIPHS